MDKFFFTHYGYLFLALSGLYFTGYLLLWLVKLLPEKPQAVIFSSLLTGITVVATITALLATKGHTIFLAIPFLILLLYFKVKGENQIPTPTFSLKEHGKNLVILSVAGLLIFGFRYWFGYAVYGQPAIHDDLIYYSKLSGYMLKTGLETSNIEYIYLKENARLPYHYLEIWLNAAFLKIFGAASVHLLYLVTYSLGCVVVWAGFCALFESRIKLTWLLKLLLLLCLVLSGVDFPDRRNVYFEYTVYLQFNSVFYSKLFPVIIFLIGALLLFEYRKEKAALILLLFLPVVSVISAPGVLGGLACYAVYLFWKRQRKEALQLAILLFLTGIFFFLFYSVFNVPVSSPYKTHLSEKIGHLISNENLVSVLILVGRTLLQLFLTFGPFLFIATFFMGPEKLKASLRTKAFWVSFFICLASLLAWAFLENMTDSLQFFTNLGNPLMNLGLLILFRSVLEHSRYKLVFVGWVLITLFFNFRETVKYLNIVPKTSLEYQKQVAEALKSRNPVGGYFKAKEEYGYVYTKSSNIFPMGTYLAYTPETQYHHAVNLTVFEIPINPDNEALETQLVQNTSFYNFVGRQKTEGSFKSLPESQLNFIQQFKTDFLLVSKAASLPENIAERFQLKTTDPLSGEKLYLLK